MRDIEVKQVEGVIYGLDLAHLHEPHLDVLGRCGKNALAMIVGLADDRAQVFKALHHPDCHLPAVGSEIRAWVQRGAEPFANLFDTKFQLLALKLI